MKQKILKHYKSALLFGIGCLLSIGFIVWQWQWFEQDKLNFTKQLNKATPSKDLFENIPEVRNGLVLREEYEEIVNAPLFIEGRKPIATTDLPIQGESGNTLLKLTGVILGPSHLLALITDDKNLSYRLKVSDEIQGWKITVVQKDMVKLQKNNESKELTLIENKQNTNNIMPSNQDTILNNSPGEMEITNPSDVPYAP